jgi:hypothetical protein
VKELLVLLLLLSSCSSWKQKDFEKELSSRPEEAKPIDGAASPKVEKLLEKFEVQPVEEAKQVETKKPSPVIAKPKPVLKKATPVEKKAEVVPPAPKFPKNYPENYKTINENAKKIWDLYKPNHFVDQKVYLDIYYLGMTVGKIMVENKGKKILNDKEVWHFHARFKSAPFYSNIYELDDTVDTYVTTDKFLSTKYSLVQRESKQDIDDLQLHDRDLLKTFWFYKRKKEDGSIKEKKEEKFIPYFSVDPFSVLFFYQGLPLANGDVYEIPLINKGKILIFKSQVEGRETIKTSKGQRQAIRVHATTKYTGETLKSGDLYFWFSDDDKRTLLKAQAKIKIGSVTAEIVDK